MLFALSEIHWLLWRGRQFSEFQKHPDVFMSFSVTDTPSTPMKSSVVHYKRMSVCCWRRQLSCEVFEAFLSFCMGVALCHRPPEAAVMWRFHSTKSWNTSNWTVPPSEARQRAMGSQWGEFDTREGNESCCGKLNTPSHMKPVSSPMTSRGRLQWLLKQVCF